MVETAIGEKKHFRLVEHIQIAEVQEQAHEYFELLEFGNVIDPLPIPLTVSYLTHLSDGDSTQATEKKMI